MAPQLRWQIIQSEIGELQGQIDDLRKEHIRLQEVCVHARLPKREGLTEFRDTCPDCGFVSYMYAL